MKRFIWNKAHPILGYDPTEWRKDDFGSIIRYSHYGDQNSEYGWQKDHIVPNALGGLDTYDNYRPLHWRNNTSLGGKLGSLLR